MALKLQYGLDKTSEVYGETYVSEFTSIISCFAGEIASKNFRSLDGDS